MQFGTAAADAEGQAGDGAAIDTSEACCGAYAHAFGEGGDDLNLLVARERIHGRSSPTCCGTDPKQDSGKIGRFGLYLSGGPLLRGLVPGL